MIIKRNIFDKLMSQLNRPQISIIIGARQAGKSTLLKEIQKKISIPSIFYNFENPLHLRILQDGYNSFINEIGKEKKVVFIDEFHYYKNITSVFKVIYDLNPQIKIYATGSSSMEIHKHLKESLAGRKFETYLFPLNFSEWLIAKGMEIPDITSSFKTIIHEQLKHYLKEFLKYGAMPGLIHFNNEIEKLEYLESIYSTYIAKDVKTFLKEEKILDFNKLIELLILLNAKSLNENSLSKESKLSIRQVKKYIDILKETFIIFLLKPLFANKKKEITKTSKLYFYDSGISNMMLRNFTDIELRIDKGEIIEQFVFLELIKSIDIRYELRYWRTADKYEVDFVILRDNKKLPIEVKTRWDKDKIPSGLRKFFEYYPEVKSGVILQMNEKREFKYNDKTIYVFPLYYASQLIKML